MDVPYVYLSSYLSVGMPCQLSTVRFCSIVVAVARQLNATDQWLARWQLVSARVEWRKPTTTTTSTTAIPTTATTTTQTGCSFISSAQSLAHTHTPTLNKRLAERKSFVDTCRGCCSTTKASRSANRHNLPMPCPILIASFALPMHIQFYALPCDNMGHLHRSYPPSPSHRW